MPVKEDDIDIICKNTRQTKLWNSLNLKLERVSNVHVSRLLHTDRVCIVDELKQVFKMTMFP